MWVSIRKRSLRLILSIGRLPSSKFIFRMSDFDLRITDFCFRNSGLGDRLFMKGDIEARSTVNREEISSISPGTRIDDNFDSRTEIIFAMRSLNTSQHLAEVKLCDMQASIIGASQKRVALPIGRNENIKWVLSRSGNLLVIKLSIFFYFNREKIYHQFASEISFFLRELAHSLGTES